MWHSIESFGYSVTFIDHQDRSARTEARLGCCLTSCSGEPVSVMAAKVDCDHHVGLPAGEQRLGPSRLYSRSGLLATFRGLDSAADHVRQAAGPVVGGPLEGRAGSCEPVRVRRGRARYPVRPPGPPPSPPRWRRRPDTRAAHGADHPGTDTSANWFPAVAAAVRLPGPSQRPGSPPAARSPPPPWDARSPVRQAGTPLRRLRCENSPSDLPAGWFSIPQAGT